MGFAIFPLVAILVIIAMIIGLVLYNRAYKRNINEALNSDEDRPRRHMSSPVEIILVIIVIVAVFNAINSSGTINTLQNQVNQLNGNVYELTNEIRYLRDLLENETSIITDSNVQVLDMDMDAAVPTATIRVTVKPNNIAEDATISLSVGDRVIDMEKQGLRYVAEFDTPIFNNVDEVICSVVSDGVVRTQAAGLDLTTLAYDVLPSMDVLDMDGGSTASVSECKVYVKGTVALLNQELNKGRIKSVALVTTVDDVVVDRVDLTKEVLEKGEVDINYQQKCDSKKDIVIYVDTTDISGYTVRNCLISEFGSDSSIEFCPYLIIAPNGEAYYIW